MGDKAKQRLIGAKSRRNSKRYVEGIINGFNIYFLGFKAPLDGLLAPLAFFCMAVGSACIVIKCMFTPTNKRSTKTFMFCLALFAIYYMWKRWEEIKEFI